MPEIEPIVLETNTNVEIRRLALEQGKIFFAQIKSKQVSGTLKKKIQDMTKASEGKDDFSFIFLTFLLTCAEVVGNNYKGFPIFSSLLLELSISRLLNAYNNVEDQPNEVLLISLQRGIAFLELRSEIDTTVTSADVARLLRLPIETVI